MTQTEWENEMCIKILELIQNELYVDFRYLDVAVSALTLTPNDSLRSTATDGISFFSLQNRFFGYSAPTRFS